MLKHSKLFAMAAKLEEEGIITPNTEVEVSASVSVTPEEQEKIDEALTQVEEIATAENELEEATQEIEDLEEAETTLSAIRDTIKRDGIVTPQLYAFLQTSGYLEAISAFQKNVAYPAVEAITPVTVNKQYADSIIAGCEAGIESIQKSYEVAMEGFFDKVKATINRYLTLLDASERKIVALHDTLKSMPKVEDLSDTNYSATFPDFEQMKKVLQATEKFDNIIKNLRAKSKNVFSSAERGNTGIIEQFKKNWAAMDAAVEEVKELFDQDNSKYEGGKWSLADAGFTYDNLTGEAFTIATKLKKHMNSLEGNWNEFFNLAHSFDVKKHPIRHFFLGINSVFGVMNKWTNFVQLCYRGYIAAAIQAIKAAKKVQKD